MKTLYPLHEVLRRAHECLRYDRAVASFPGFVRMAAFIGEVIADLLAVGRRSMRLDRFA